MGVTVALDRANIEVQPGQQAFGNVLVRNTGSVVDRILLDILGQARHWVTADPAEISLLPGTSATARIVFSPPRAATTRAGEFPFALRAFSQEDPEGSVIVEGAVTLAPFTEILADLVPRTSHARRRGRHRLIVENRGNSAADLTLTGSDADNALEFGFRPDLFTAEPGTATFVRLRADPRKRFLKGPSKSLPFQAFVLNGQAEPVTVDGAVLQRQIMPEWLLPLLALGTVAAAALIALWFLVFKPEVHSAAVQAVSQQTHALASSAAKASQAAVKADKAAANAASAAGSAGSAAAKASKSSGASSASSAAASTAAIGTPVSTLMASNVAPGKTTIYPYKLTGKETLRVSDVLLENPAGNTGTMNIQSGSSPLFEFALADFRDLDYHFVQPLVFSAKHPLEVVVSCTDTGSSKCTPALSFSGTVSTPKPPSKPKKLSAVRCLSGPESIASDEALADGVGHRVRAVAQLEAAGDVVEHAGHRAGRVGQPGRDLLGVQAVGGQPEHVHLTGGQAVEGEPARRQHLPVEPADLLEQPGQHVGGQRGLPGGRLGDHLAEPGRGGLPPPHHGGDPGVDHGQHVVVGQRVDHQHGARTALRLHPAQRGQHGLVQGVGRDQGDPGLAAAVGVHDLEFRPAHQGRGQPGQRYRVAGPHPHRYPRPVEPVGQASLGPGSLGPASLEPSSLGGLAHAFIKHPAHSPPQMAPSMSVLAVRFLSLLAAIAAGFRLSNLSIH
jgi:hypothetical protein